MEGLLEVTVGNRLSELQRLADTVEGFVLEHGLPVVVAFKINLCLDELITNTISYGYDDDAPHDILVRIETDGRFVRATLSDDGVPFDPFQEAPPPDLDSDVESRPIGGLGVFIVGQTMDETSYRREDGRNVVTLVKDAAAS